MNGLTKTEQKYLDLFFEIENRCKTLQQFTISEITDEYRATKVIGKVLQDKGIIKNVSSKRNPIYVWSTIRPNIKMVRAVLQVIRDDQNVRNANRPERKKSVPYQSKIKAKVVEAKKQLETIKVAPRMHPVVESKQKSIVILWGLINIKF